MVKACLYDPDISELYAAFARHYSFVPLPCRPRRPQEDGIAERSGGYVKSNALKGKRFNSLDELNEYRPDGTVLSPVCVFTVPHVSRDIPTFWK